ncbi:spondin-1 isoform X1, partial [Lates japonicus]
GDEVLTVIKMKAQWPAWQPLNVCLPNNQRNTLVFYGPLRAAEFLADRNPSATHVLPDYVGAQSRDWNVVCLLEDSKKFQGWSGYSRRVVQDLMEVT